MDDPELERLLDWRRQLDEISAVPHPAARLLTPLGSPPRRIAVLSGAFNPPTLAHLALARAAKKLDFGLVLFSLGRLTLDKDESGLMLEDRLLLLTRISAREPGTGVVIQNSGLYGEQAEALRKLFPGAVDLAFAVGMDKLPQIFDPRYYRDVDSALAALFARARLLVASRGPLGRRSLRRFLERIAGRRFAGEIDWLPLHRRWREISATAVRERLANGEDASDWLSADVAAFLRRTRAFTPEGDRRYAQRVARVRA